MRYKKGLNKRGAFNKIFRQLFQGLPWAKLFWKGCYAMIQGLDPFIHMAPISGNTVPYNLDKATFEL